MENYLGRKVHDVIEFKVDGTFKSFYAAREWLKSSGYSPGSMARDSPIAFMKGEYTLPEKWYNISEEERNIADGVMVSKDFREGEVKIIIFE